jgi:hypothetical protein
MRYEQHSEWRPIAAPRFPIYTLEIWRIIHIMRRAIIGFILRRPYGADRVARGDRGA